MIAVFCRLTGLDARKVRYARNRMIEQLDGMPLVAVSIGSIGGFFAIVIWGMAQ